MKSFLTYLEEDEKWITIEKKQNSEHKGSHVLINMETGDIVKGLGNKFKNLKDLGGNTTDIDSEFTTKKKQVRECDKEKIHLLISKAQYDIISHRKQIKGLLEDFPDMKEEEAISLHGYTGHYYEEFNSDDKDYADAKNALSNALLKMPNHEGVVKRTSHLPADVLKSYLENDYVTTGNRFTSTSKDMGLNFDGSGHTFFITSKTGKDVEPYSDHPNEAEVLFDRDTNFKITDRKQKENGKYEFTMEEI
ncbi:MAG: ADP-ribosyltransferase domain-containing protein [Bacteroidales bacterium]|jgi:hypothetical protein